MWQILLSKIWFPIIRFLPAFIVSKFITTQSVREDLELDLRSINSINININTDIPEFTLWLRVTNKCSIPIRIDRILFDIWIGQPFIDGVLLRPIEILPKKTQCDVRFLTKLSDRQIQVVKRHQESNRGINFTIHIYAYCECKLGKFDLTVNKEVPLKY